MFVKKDLRKIPEILDEARRRATEPPPSSPADPRAPPPPPPPPPPLTELRLSRRPAEFGGALSVLCRRSNGPALRGLVGLSLYDCRITSLDGIGMLGSDPDGDCGGDVDDGDGDGEGGGGGGGGAGGLCPYLRELNVGRNPLTSLPDEMSNLAGSLTALWCDDCDIRGSVPGSVLKLRRLEVLRISNNSITTIPGGMGESLRSLRVLCLDGNDIATVPPGIAALANLESLMLRQNRIERLPEGVPGRAMSRLTLLHVSSNRLRALPQSLSECGSLEKVYGNGNVIEEIPHGIGSGLVNLNTLNLSTNSLRALPPDFVERFGEPDSEGGVCAKDESCRVCLDQNPIVDLVRRSLLETEEGSSPDVGGGPAPMDVCA